ncbi:sialic acid-binding Ig-like lectin 16 isoform X2 [Aquarana catesbeiana]|uniref:sialic acid-binding Ig-like lectin 16 isoform X2 n=1 Tax=Aquarana catesbeiana TaxID=8400 RepID=UPI003CCA5936
MTLKRRSYHLSYYHILIYIISHLWSGIESKLNPGYSIKVSTHVTVQQGLCVHIPCSFTVPKDVALTKDANGIWYKKYGKPVASKRNTEFAKNYRFLLTGNIQRGDCSLYIEDPLPDDKGSYYFRVEDDIKFNYLDIQPYVEVTELTTKPKISPIKSWLVGEKLEMECTFTDNCKRTSPQMKWEGNYQDASVTTTHTSHINGLNTHRSIIIFIVGKEQNNSPLSCMLWLTERVTALNHVTLNVEYPPSVDITIDDKTLSIIVIEGQTKSLECNVDSNPVAEITWFHEDRQLPVINQSLIYILKNISLNHTGRYSCKARNQYGTADKTIYISVDYPPRTPDITCFMPSKDLNDNDCTMNDNNTIYVSEGSLLSLTCSANSEPVSDLKWTTSNELENAFPTDTLNLTNLSLTDEGPYKCQATNAHGTSRTLVNVKIMYSPKIVNGRNSSCWKVAGNHLACTCVIQSVPEPTLKWKINGRSINVSNHMNGKVSIFTERSNSVTNSTLTLPVNTEESQNIQCVASNIHGELVLELFNETAQSASKAFPAAAIYGGCVIAVLIVIGILLIFFYRKRKMTKYTENSRQTHVSVTDPIYGNSEMFSNGYHESEQSPQNDHQPLPETGSVNLNYQDLQYMSVDFSKLNPKVAIEEEEVEYSVVKHIN